MPESSKVVGKYHLQEHPGKFRLPLPEGYQILSVQRQQDRTVLYASVNPSGMLDAQNYKQVVVSFYAVETGDECPSPEQATYIGTAMLLGGTYVLHYFVSTAT
jgi:hypothetical protein